eukprot:4614175-Pleurochrysis_carterae.AAC.1
MTPTPSPFTTVFSTPPGRATRGRASARDIHYDATHWKERARREWFGEEICQVLCAAHEWYGYAMRLHPFAHEEVAPVYVL